MTAATTAGGGGDLWFDAVVVGAGVAGLVAALELRRCAPRLSVAVVDKGTIGSSGSTPLAQGGMAAAVGPGDSPALHASDTIRAGDGLCDPYAVHTMTVEGPARVRGLQDHGVVFDREPDGRLALAREGGQSLPRSVKAADATGAEIFRALRASAVGEVTRLQGTACALAVADAPARAVGVWVVLDAVGPTPAGPAQEAGLALVRGAAVLLATGGCGGLYAATTNRDGATADGVAIAYRAGAALADMEFVQFHPTALRPGAGTGAGQGSGHWRLLLTEALRGAGARLVDRDGRRFMVERHRDAELAPRHVVTKGILDQPGGAWLDATALGRPTLQREFPTVLRGVARHGYDLGSEPVPVEPAEHYMIGGVVTDLHGRSSVPGLYAAGEVASTGVHGANRMAGNSLLQSCVFGHRAARAIAAEGDEGARAAREAEPEAPSPPAATPERAPAAGGPDPTGLRAALRLAMSSGAGPVRSAASLDLADKALDEAAAAAAPDRLTREAIELDHALLVGRLIVRSARLRTESRGVHWRDDAPGPAPEWDGVRLRVAAVDRPAAGPG